MQEAEEVQVQWPYWRDVPLDFKSDLSRLLKDSADHVARAVAAVCDRRDSTTCREATLTERRYNEFFSNLLGRETTESVACFSRSRGRWPRSWLADDAA